MFAPQRPLDTDEMSDADAAMTGLVCSTGLRVQYRTTSATKRLTARVFPPPRSKWHRPDQSTAPIRSHAHVHCLACMACIVSAVCLLVYHSRELLWRLANPGASTDASGISKE